MATNLMETASALEKTIRDSAEFSELKTRYAELNQDESAKGLFENFRNVQLELQEKQMTGQPISDEEVQRAQSIVAVVQQNPKIVALMDAEQKMSTVIAEINKIVMKPLEELYANQM